MPVPVPVAGADADAGSRCSLLPLAAPSSKATPPFTYESRGCCGCCCDEACDLDADIGGVLNGATFGLNNGNRRAFDGEGDGAGGAAVVIVVVVDDDDNVADVVGDVRWALSNGDEEPFMADPLMPAAVVVVSLVGSKSETLIAIDGCWFWGVRGGGGNDDDEGADVDVNAADDGGEDISGV